MSSGPGWTWPEPPELQKGSLFKAGVLSRLLSLSHNINANDNVFLSGKDKKQ